MIEELRAELNDGQMQLRSKDTEHSQLHAKLQQLQEAHSSQTEHLDEAQAQATKHQKDRAQAQQKASDVELELAKTHTRCVHWLVSASLLMLRCIDTLRPALHSEANCYNIVQDMNCAQAPLSCRCSQLSQILACRLEETTLRLRVEGDAAKRHRQEADDVRAQLATIMSGQQSADARAATLQEVLA